MTGQRLPRAYRSRPRPSSALSAKASTVCPCSLDQKNTGYRCRYGVFKVHATDVALRELPAPPLADRARSLKTQQRTSRSWLLASKHSRGRRYSRRTGCPDGNDRHRRAQRLPPCIGGIPRKEVIQPQLPLRLPCYDFTPVTSPTVDGSLPCGLGHRLRVLLTPVV